MKYKYLILFSALALLAAVILYAPTYLRYQDQPAKADAVVIFVGSDMDARIKEANRLLSAGYADYLIVPLSEHIYRASDRGNINLFRSESFGKYPRLYESTHMEVLEAKRIMDLCGFKRAIFVGTLTRMRRIKVMTDQVFHPGYQIKFVPAKNDESSFDPGEFIRGIGTMASEYIKIAWFLTYQLVS